jgi:hypothetical protein
VAVHCCKIGIDNVDEYEPHDIQIKKSKGEYTLNGKATEMDAPDYNGSIKNKKHNIGIEEAPNVVIIRDYWDKETITQVVDLLKEYEDLFPRRFSKMKHIVGSLGAMKI